MSKKKKSEFMDSWMAYFESFRKEDKKSDVEVMCFKELKQHYLIYMSVMGFDVRAVAYCTEEKRELLKKIPGFLGSKKIIDKKELDALRVLGIQISEF